VGQRPGSGHREYPGRVGMQNLRRPRPGTQNARVPVESRPGLSAPPREPRSTKRGRHPTNANSVEAGTSLAQQRVEASESNLFCYL
jgi:hypothetical protein